MKNKTKILCVIAFTLGILVYINPLFIYRNYKLINHIESISHKETITKEDLIPFDYDKLYVVYPYTSKKDIEKDLKIKSRYIKLVELINNYFESKIEYTLSKNEIKLV